MRINNSQLVGLPVITQTGELLGQVVGFEVDTDQHMVTTYLVGPGKLIERIFGTVRNIQPLAIACSQVVSIDNEKMLVHDSVLHIEAGNKMHLPSISPTQPNPTIAIQSLDLEG